MAFSCLAIFPTDSRSAMIEPSRTLEDATEPKGKFIEIPVPEKKPEAKIKPHEQKPATVKPSAQPTEQRPGDGLTPMERYRLLRHY